MAKTYVELNQEIEALKAEAKSVFESEVVEVVGRIRQAIEVYGLTAADLGFGPGGSKARANGAGRAAGVDANAVKSGASGKPRIKYRDAAGNAWSGRGHRPRWLQAALDGGASLDSLTVPPGEAAADEAAPNAARKSGAARKAAKRPASAPKYKDDAGHSWSGRGPRPRWFKEALARGVTAEQMAA